MALTEQDCELYAGDDHILEYTITDENNAPLDITGATITWIAWDGATAVITKSTSSGISITDAPGGVFRLTLAPTDTYALTPKAYTHGASISIEAGAYMTVATGTMILKTKVRS